MATFSRGGLWKVNGPKMGPELRTESIFLSPTFRRPPRKLVAERPEASRVTILNKVSNHLFALSCGPRPNSLSTLVLDASADSDTAQWYTLRAFIIVPTLIIVPAGGPEGPQEGL